MTERQARKFGGQTILVWAILLGSALLFGFIAPFLGLGSTLEIGFSITAVVFAAFVTVVWVLARRTGIGRRLEG